MYTPKQALLKDGRIPVKEGRGRLSREADARCRELAAEGWNIKGYAVSAVSTPSPKGETPSVTKTVVTNEKVIADFVILYDERSYSALDKTGKSWSMRNACNNCRVSLVQCHCGNPSIFGDIGVTITPT